MIRFVASLAAVSLLSSCATVIRGRNEVISVDSNPSGATATITCAGNVSATGMTPARLTIPRSADGCSVRVEKSGTKAESIAIERGFNSSYWLNFIVPAAGITVAAVDSLSFVGYDRNQANTALGVAAVAAAGFVVDRVTGAMYDHNPHVIKVTLQPEH
jgi:hypothetical protein